MLTPEQRVIEILKDRLPIDMHHYQYQELAAEILTALTEPEDEPFTVEGSSGLVDPKGYVENSGDGGLLTAEDEPKTLSELFAYENAEPEDENQITLRKWNEFYNEYLKQDKITHFFQFPNWLQQDGEK